MVGPPKYRVGVQEIAEPPTDPLARLDRHSILPVHQDPEDLGVGSPRHRAPHQLEAVLREQGSDQIDQILAPHARCPPGDKVYFKQKRGHRPTRITRYARWALAATGNPQPGGESPGRPGRALPSRWGGVRGLGGRDALPRSSPSPPSLPDQVVRGSSGGAHRRGCANMDR